MFIGVRKFFKKKYVILYIVCFLLPIINLVNNNLIYTNESSIIIKIASYLLVSFMLLTVCLVNIVIEEVVIQRIVKHSWTIIVILQLITNTLIAIFYVLLDFNIIAEIYGMGGIVPKWVMFFKLSSGLGILIIIQGTIRTYEDGEKTRDKNARLINENLQAEFNVLKHQINIHFLNNSLSTLISLVRLKDPNTELYIMSLANIYRQLLSKQHKITVSLKEELDMLHSYIFMMKVCYEGCLKINIEIDPSNINRQLPTFSLQVLTENCIKHNIISSSKPLSINIYQKDLNSITVENTYQPKTSITESTGIGLLNLQNRYNLLKVADGLTITQNDNIFTVTIKFI